MPRREEAYPHGCAMPFALQVRPSQSCIRNHMLRVLDARSKQVRSLLSVCQHHVSMEGYDPAGPADLLTGSLICLSRTFRASGCSGSVQVKLPRPRRIHRFQAPTESPAICCCPQPAMKHAPAMLNLHLSRRHPQQESCSRNLPRERP